jgi:hypothetical protein
MFYASLDYAGGNKEEKKLSFPDGISTTSDFAMYANHSTFLLKCFSWSGMELEVLHF